MAEPLNNLNHILLGKEKPATEVTGHSNSLSDGDSQEFSTLAHRLIGQTGADIEKLVRAARASARRAGRVFSPADIGAQIPDPYNNLPARTRRRIAIYRNAQRIVAQVLGLAEMVPNPQDLGRLVAKVSQRSDFTPSRPATIFSPSSWPVVRAKKLCSAMFRHSDRVSRVQIWPSPRRSRAGGNNIPVVAFLFRRAEKFSLFRCWKLDACRRGGRVDFAIA